MIGHDDPAVELILDAMKVMQAVPKVVGPTLLFEVTRAVAFVGPSFRAANDLASVLVPVLFGSRFGMSVLPKGAQVLDLGQLRLRKRIGEPERDKIGRSVLPPVRQMPVVLANPLVWMQTDEAGRLNWRMATLGRLRFVDHWLPPNEHRPESQTSKFACRMATPGRPAVYFLRDAPR